MLGRMEVRGEDDRLRMRMEVRGAGDARQASQFSERWQSGGLSVFVCGGMG